MRKQKITLEHFESIYAILEETFPKEELQPKSRQKEIFSRQDFFGVLLEKDQKIQALLLGYQREDYLFLEYFVVMPNLRGQGLGQKFLKEALDESNVPVILEVEPPVSELTTRRVHFYERLGFYLNPYDYRMPRLGDGHGDIPLKVMSYPQPLKKDAFQTLKTDIYHKIYEVQ